MCNPDNDFAFALEAARRAAAAAPLLQAAFDMAQDALAGAREKGENLLWTVGHVPADRLPEAVLHLLDGHEATARAMGVPVPLWVGRLRERFADAA